MRFQAITVPTSASYKISLDSIGEGVVRTGLSSASYHMDGSFGGCYPPPGEVLGLKFYDAVTLIWDPEKSVGNYNLYRGTMGNGFFYLVTAENRLDEEGTKGDGRTGAVCP